jgi:hypothetical protein
MGVDGRAELLHRMGVLGDNRGKGAQLRMED